MKKYVHRIKLAITALLLATSFSLVPATVGYAQNPRAELCKGATGSASCTPQGATTIEQIITSIVNILLFLIGAVCVIMIIVGGIRYAVSNGDQGQITSAKNTILYAIVGLVVAFAAYAIVTFVINQIS